MDDPNRSVAAALEDDPPLSWDLIPDDGAAARAIIMRFASREAAHAVLTQAGFTVAADATEVGRTALRYTHPDGSSVVLAHRMAEGLATVGG